MICSPCGTISSIKPVVTDVDKYYGDIPIKPVVTDVDKYYGSQPRLVQDAASVTEAEMKQLVQDCFDEIEKVQKEKPVPGSKRVKFEPHIFNDAGSLVSLV